MYSSISLQQLVFPRIYRFYSLRKANFPNNMKRFIHKSSARFLPYLEKFANRIQFTYLMKLLNIYSTVRVVIKHRDELLMPASNFHINFRRYRLIRYLDNARSFQRYKYLPGNFKDSTCTCVLLYSDYISSQ